jgi:hypothetical protein
MGAHHGRTTITLARSEADNDPYEEQREDVVHVRSSGSRYVIEWLGCEFEASKNHNDEGDDLESTTCTFNLEDGREISLVTGHVLNPYVDDGTTTTLFLHDEQVVIDVVAAVTIDGVHYRPSYFRFEENGAP